MQATKNESFNSCLKIHKNVPTLLPEEMNNISHIKLNEDYLLSGN